MDIDLKGQSVTQVDFDYTVSVHTDGGYEIQIESFLDISRANAPLNSLAHVR